VELSASNIHGHSISDAYYTVYHTVSAGLQQPFWRLADVQLTVLQHPHVYPQVE